MAVIFADGFDWYATADLPLRWTDTTAYGANLLIGPTYARSPSGQGLLFLSGNSNARLIKSFGSNYTQGVIGFAIRTAGTWVSRQLVLVLDGATEQFSIRTNASSVLTVQQGATVKATGSTVLAANTWYYVECKFTAHGAAGVAEVKLNGASEIASTSSLDLTGTANNYWNGVSLAPASNSYSPSFDDLYILDPTTGTNTDFLGPVQVVARYPDGNGNASSWTPNGGSNMGCVSEPYQDGNGSFVQSATANQIDTYTMQNLPAAAGSVFAVAQHTVAAQDGGAARTIAPVYRIGGTDYVGANVNTGASYQFFTEIADVSPATSAAWDVAEVDGLESGFKLIA
jgi:hypothetical protein